MELKKIRWIRDLTQEELAELVGVTPKTVSSWEKGTMPQYRLLRQLALALDINEGTAVDAILEARGS